MARNKMVPDLSALEREHALALAEQLYCNRMSRCRVIRTIANRYSISEKQAAVIASDSEDRLIATIRENAPKRREHLLASIDQLYWDCVKDKRYGTAVSAARLIAQVEGYLKPMLVMPVGKPDDTFAGRTHEECHYFAQHGHFPDEAPEKAPATVEKNEGLPDFPPLH